MFVFFTSCRGQNETDIPNEKIKFETKDKVTFYWSNEKGIDTKYEYIESNDARLIIQNGLSKLLVKQWIVC